MYVYKLVTNRPKHVCLTHHCLACYCHCFVLPTGSQEAGSCWSGVCHHRRMWRTGQDRGSPATRECGSLQTGSGYHWEVLQWGMWESTLLEHVHIHCILVQVVVMELRLNWLIFSWTDHNNEIICFLFTYTQDEEDQSLAPNTSNGAFQFSPAVQTVPAGGFNFWLLPTTTSTSLVTDILINAHHKQWARSHCCCSVILCGLSIHVLFVLKWTDFSVAATLIMQRLIPCHCTRLN